MGVQYCKTAHRILPEWKENDYRFLAKMADIGAQCQNYAKLCTVRDTCKLNVVRGKYGICLLTWITGYCLFCHSEQDHVDNGKQQECVPIQAVPRRTARLLPILEGWTSWSKKVGSLSYILHIAICLWSEHIQHVKSVQSILLTKLLVDSAFWCRLVPASITQGKNWDLPNRIVMPCHPTVIHEWPL